MASTQTAADLRHFTSNSNLNTHRLRSSPARSPTSIPSSPTSVHSSSSAIFERDIEPLSPPSPLSSMHSISSDPHRIPRSKTTEQIEHSVPSVLDSAAAILASMQPNDVAVVAPASSGSTFFGSGFASPIGSFRSRSPSPTIGGHGRASLLLSIPQQQQQQQQQQAKRQDSTSVSSHPVSTLAQQPPPKIQTANTSPSQPPSIITPTSAYFSVVDESETTFTHEAEPSTAVEETAPSPLPISPTTLPQTSESQFEALSRSPRSLSSSPSGRNNQQRLPSLGLGSPMPSSASSPITNSASKRLSFVSYADLLSSAPTSMVPLASLTVAASAFEPPPHITHNAGLNGVPTVGSHPGSRGTSLRGFAMHGPYSPSDPLGSSPTKNVRDSMLLVEDAGGEWEREGLGKGLEERLDVLYGPTPSMHLASASA